jgi:hypothetical protein
MFGRQIFMRNARTSTPLQQGENGLITLAAMQAAANRVKSSYEATSSTIYIEFSNSPRIVSLAEDKLTPVVKGDVAFA